MIVDFCRQKKGGLQNFFFQEDKTNKVDLAGFFDHSLSWGSDIRLQYISEYALKLLIIVDSKTYFYRNFFLEINKQTSKEAGSFDH